MEKEKANCFRFIYLMVEVVPEILRFRLKQSYRNSNPGTLPYFLKETNVLHTLFHLFNDSSSYCCLNGCRIQRERPKGFSKEQWKILYDADSTKCCKTNAKYPNRICICCVAPKNIDEKVLDLSLLCLILNNCSNLMPNEKEAVQNIREMKNDYVSHTSSCRLSESDFLSLWQKAEIYINHLDSTKIYLHQRENLLKGPIDESLMQQYFVQCLDTISEIKTVHASIDKGNEDIKDIKETVAKINSYLINMQRQEPRNAVDKRKREEPTKCSDVSNEEENIYADDCNMFNKRKHIKLNSLNLHKGITDDLRFKLPDTKPLDKNKEYISSNLLGSKVPTSFSLQMDYQVCTMKDLSKQPGFKEANKFICGKCCWLTISLDDFLKHLQQCEMRQKENIKVKNDYKNYVVARLIIPTKDKDLSSKIEKEWQQGNINPHHSSIEVNYITTGSVVIWVKVDLLLFLDIQKFYSALDNLVNDIFKKYKKYAVNLPLYCVQVYDIATGYVDNLADEFHCGDCELKCNTLDNFISHKKTRCIQHILPEDEITRKQEELAKKAEEYTTTVGSYTAWNTNVDLGPPDSTVSLTKDDVHIQDYYNALQYSLFENNLPETIDRTQKPRTSHPDTEVAIVVLASPVECLAILLEGGRQCPGEMLLVMSPTWLIKDKSNKGEGQHSLFVKKAIVFDRTGTSFIDVFEKPRRCTYFVNFFTRACTDGQRNDGVDIELDLDCPMSSSVELCKYVDDKLLTRIWMAEAGVHYPETLAVVYKPAYEYNVPNDANIEVICVEKKQDVNNAIEDKVKHFLKLESIQSIGKIVVKPSGVMWHGSRCVSFHEVTNVEEICKAVTDLLSILEVENAVMVEAFYHPVESTNPKLADYSFRLRTNVCRRINDTPIATQMVCGIGLKNQPINGDNTIPHSFETTMQMWNMDKAEIKRLLKTVSQGSEKIMDSIIAFERTLSTDLRGGVGAQTDLIGIDYVLGTVNGQMEPVGIEVNSHDCTINCQLFEFLNPHLQGEAVKPLVETMIRRSQLFAMQDKTVLVIGAGGFSKLFIWDSYKSFGLNVVLVDPDDLTYAASKASHFIQYNFLDHKHDDDHATYIIKLLKERELAVDGCVTFWEDCGPLAATVCESLKLNGPGKQAAKIAKMKSWTHNVLRTKTGDIPHFPRTHLYTSKCHPVKSESDIDKAIDHVGIPAVLKLEYGSSAVGVKPVRDRIQCTNTYQQIKNHLRSEADHPGIGLGYGNDVMLMENIDGTEHDVDVVIFQRQLITAFVSDNGPVRNGSYTETTALMPTCLPLDRRGQLITAAYQCCTEIGLVDGVFNVEMKMTNTGPKLIEINARMGGFYLRDWIQACYGHDILLYAFMISLGIRPVITKREPRCTILGTMCVPSAHKQQLKNPNNLNLLNTLIQKKAVRYNQIEASLEDCGSADEEEPFCSIAVVDENLNMKRAKRKLTNICNALGLNTKTYDLNYLLSDFNES